MSDNPHQEYYVRPVRKKDRFDNELDRLHYIESCTTYGLKGAMSEAELHILRARLDGGIRNKAQRGELYRGQPIGYVRGEGDAEILLDPDEEVQGAIRAVFERFAEFGSARRVWRWFVTEKLDFPHRFHLGADLRWEPPSYHTIHMVLTNPVYAGAYAYGKTRREHHVDASGAVRKRSRKMPRSEWQVLIHDHHPGYIDWQTHEAILERLASNTRPQPHGAGEGAVREGTALLQGIGTCGACGRRLATHYTGRTSSPGYHCNGKELVEGRQNACLYVGAVQIDRAVSKAVLEAIQPAAIEAALKAAEHLEADHDQALDQRRLWRSSGPATKPSGPSGDIGRSSRSIVSSRAGWSGIGNSV